MKLCFILTLLFWSVCSSVRAEDVFLPGEVITYDIKQFVAKVGTATIEFKGRTTIHNQPADLIVFTADALNFYDKEEIYVNPDTYKPIVVERDVNVWGKKEKITEEYLTAQGQIKITKRVKDKVEVIILDKPGEIDNLYGFIYHYRSQGSFDIGDSLAMNLPTKDVRIEAQKKTTIKAAGQSQSAVYFESSDQQYKVWFDESNRRVPLKIAGSVGVGSTVMVMKSYVKGGDTVALTTGQ